MRSTVLEHPDFAEVESWKQGTTYAIKFEGKKKDADVDFER